MIKLQTERQLQLRLKQKRLVPVRPRAPRRAVRVTADVPTADANSIATSLKEGTNAIKVAASLLAVGALSIGTAPVDCLPDQC